MLEYFYLLFHDIMKKWLIDRLLDDIFCYFVFVRIIIDIYIDIDGVNALNHF